MTNDELESQHRADARTGQLRGSRAGHEVNPAAQLEYPMRSPINQIGNRLQLPFAERTPIVRVRNQHVAPATLFSFGPEIVRNHHAIDPSFLYRVECL